MNKKMKPIVLTVLDGWGYRAETNGNAIALEGNGIAYVGALRLGPLEVKTFGGARILEIDHDRSITCWIAATMLG